MIKKLKISLVLLSILLLISCGGNAETDLPNVPTAVKAVSVANAIKVTWKDNSKIETGFVIYREELNAADLKLAALSKLAEVDAGVQEYTDTTIDVNKTYRYSVTAKNAKGENPSDPVDNRTEAVQATPSEGFRLTIVRTSSGAGTVTSTPAGINCNYETGSGCDFVFAKNTKVSLTVTPNADSEFKGWRDIENCNGTGSCELTMDSNKTVPVDLLRTGITITVDSSIGTGIGVVTSLPVGIDCGDTCTFSTSVTPFTIFLTATPDSATSSSFVEWQGCPKVEGNTGQFCRVTQNDPGLVKIGAKFNLPAPVISSFVSDTPKVAEGGSATLSWDVDDSGNTDVSLSLTQLPAGSAEPQVIDISGKSLKDTLLVSPTVSTTYALIAKSASGDSEKKEVIVSIGDATTISFSGTDTNPADSTPETIDVTPTDTVRLSWTIAGEAPFTLSLTKTTGAGAPITVDLTGKGTTDFIDVVPGATSTYTLKALNSLGVESTATVSVEVGAAPVVGSFAIAGGDVTVPSGSTVKLDWTVASVAPVTAQTLTEDAVPIVVAPTARTFSKPLSTPTDTPETYTYELAATNRFGSSAKESLSLSVGKPAVVSSLTTADTSLPVGSLVNLNWTATGSEPITFRIRRSTTVMATLSGGERSAEVLGLANPGTVSYSIVADNAYGSTSPAQSVVVTFGNVPTIFAFTATAGVSEVLLDWTIDFASGTTNTLSLTRTDPDTVVRIVPVIPSTPTPYSDLGRNPDIETYSYTLIATNEFGSSAPSIRQVGPLPPP